MRDRRRRYVVMDTSILMALVEERVELVPLPVDHTEEVLIPLITWAVINELKKIGSKGSHRKRALARAVLEVLKRLASINRPQAAIVYLRSRYRGVDEYLLEVANRLNAVLATADVDLKDKARRLGLEVFVLRRAKRRLEPVP